MLARMQDVFRTIGRRIHDSRMPWVPRLNAEERTKLTWAKAIESYDNVPEVYKEFFEPLLANGRAFPYTVLAPSYERFGHRITDKLVCAFDHEIHVLERNGNTFEAQCHHLDGISYAEVRTRLLDSRIKISGVTRQGGITSSTIKFNSVTDYLFTPILKRIRPAGADSSGAIRSSELEKFDHWVRLNYKFMNFAKRSLLGGEKVIQAILQPEIRARMFTVFGRTFHRTIFPAHVSILTDRELIMIREEERHGREDKYGGVWDYIPVNKIAALSLGTKGEDLLALSIQLPGNEHLEYLFQASMKGEVDQLLGRFRELTLG